MSNSTPKILAKVCPSREIFSRVSGKWTIIILLSLEDQPRRFNALKKTVDGISQKVLTENLRNLERDGLVSRRVINDRPIRVEYSTTLLSLQLLTILNGLKEWTEDSMQLILKNNEKYDAESIKDPIRQLA